MGFTWSHNKESVQTLVYKLPDGCWLWLGHIDSKYGYGRLLYQGKRWQAHRLFYSLFKEVIPRDKIVCHTCDNKKCVNPDHLYLGTHHDNTQDMLTRKRNRPRHGILNPAAKLTWEDIDCIRNRCASGERCKDVGIDYNLNSYYVSRIKNKIIWNRPTGS